MTVKILARSSPAPYMYASRPQHLSQRGVLTLSSIHNTLVSSRNTHVSTHSTLALRPSNFQHKVPTKVRAMSVLPLAPPAKGPLARYRLLSPTASVRVSPLCLGGMNFGDAWKHYSGFKSQL